MIFVISSYSQLVPELWRSIMSEQSLKKYRRAVPQSKRSSQTVRCDDDGWHAACQQSATWSPRWWEVWWLVRRPQLKTFRLQRPGCQWLWPGQHIHCSASTLSPQASLLLTDQSCGTHRSFPTNQVNSFAHTSTGGYIYVLGSFGTDFHHSSSFPSRDDSQMVLVQAELTRSNVYGGVLAAWLLFWVARWVVRNYVYKRPPGPRQWPVIGSVLDFPKDHEWLTYAKWGEQYGPMVEASIFGQKVIIINKEDIAIGMLEQKNIKYSDRPAIPMANDLVGWKDGLGMLSVGDRFRSHRKMFHQVMGTTATFAEHHAIVEREMHKFLQKIQELPKDLSKHIRSTTGAIVLRLSMGYDALPHNDPFIDLADKGMEIMGLSINVGSFLVNFIPALKYVPQWFPGAGFQKVASDWRRVVQRVINEPYEYGKARFHDNTIARPSFIATMLDESEEELTPLREHDIKWSAASMYIGGVDTSFSAIYAFVLAMVLHPDIAKKAQAELDRVVGDERLPVLADRPTLPYLNALVLEVFRWHAVAPAGLPHLCNADDDYRGYFVSKGTMVVANIWQMLHDPEVYPDPFKFMPERFLGQKPQRDPRNICFGFGRRRCPGMHMGDATVFMAAASILAVYDISKIMKDGKIQEPVVGQLSALISEPAPFECTITVRSQKARDLIESEPLFI